MLTVALDNETFLITRKRPLPQVVCTAYCDGAHVGIITQGVELERFWAALLENSEIRIVGFNIAYDVLTISSSYPRLLPLVFAAYEAERIVDVGIRQQLYDIAKGRSYGGETLKSYSLSSLHESLFDKPLEGKKSSVLDNSQSVRMRYHEVYDVPLEQWHQDFVDYAKQDAVATHAIWASQERHAAKFFRDDYFQSYSMFCLALIQARGMMTDPVATEKFLRDQNIIMESLRPELLAAVLLEPNKKGGYIKKTKPAQALIVAACKDRGVSPLLTVKGQELSDNSEKYVSTDRAACHLAGSGIMLRRAEYITAEKMVSTYYEFLKEGYTLPITTRFKLVATGRTSSSAPGGVQVGGNFQNMPRAAGPRECIVPRPGYVFLAGDFSGAELHALAQVCCWRLGHSTLGDALNAGRDVHLVTAAQLLGCSYDDAVAAYKQGDPPVAGANGARWQAKAANFGFPGGMGIKTFMLAQLKDGHFWTEAEAQRVKTAWLQAYPEMTEYFSSCQFELGPKEATVIEHYITKRLRAVRGFSTICNSFFQGLTADGAKRAVNEVIRQCYVDESSALFGCRAVNFVHDEIILEIPDDPSRWPRIVKEFCATMTDQFNSVVPDYPTSVDAVLMRRWSKAAQPIYNKQGDLVPWEGKQK